MTHAIRVHRTGGPEVLQWEEVEVGDPGPGQVRLRQEAGGLNFIDVYHRTGLYPQPLPFTPGIEGAGVVEAVGADVDQRKPGDRVAYAGPIGGYAEERLIDADRLVKLPDAISDRAAAAMMLQGMTAQMLLRSVYPVQPGRHDPDSCRSRRCRPDHVPMGGGARRDGDRHGRHRREGGARARARLRPPDRLFTQQDFVAEVKRITNGEKLPVVYDSVGRDTFMKSLDCLKARGLMVSFGNASGPPEPFAPGLLAQKGSLYLTRPTLFHYIATREQLEQSAAELFDMVSSGKVKVEVKQRFALEGRGRSASRARSAQDQRIDHPHV